MSLLSACLLLQSAMLGFKLAAASNDCPPLHYYNGASCVPCSNCPRGFGVKTQCSALKDTECQECWPGYDYSGTNDMTQCIKCINDGSNCLDGNYKVISKCTIYSPTVCSGCEDGNFFDKSAGFKGGCVECSKCAFDEVETRNCRTAHDRKCEKMPSTTSEIWAPSTAGQTVTKTASKTIDQIDWTVASTRELPVSAESTSVSQKLIWGLVAGFLSAFMAVAVAIICWIRRRKGRRRKRKKNNDSNGCADQATPLRQQRGLDTLVRDLSVEDRTFISSWLNGQTSYDYYYYQLVSGKLGFDREEISQWSRSTNPTEKFLAAFGEMENGTILMLIDASRQAGLSLFASKLEEKFSQEDVAGEGRTWV